MFASWTRSRLYSSVIAVDFYGVGTAELGFGLVSFCLLKNFSIDGLSLCLSSSSRAFCSASSLALSSFSAFSAAFCASRSAIFSSLSRSSLSCFSFFSCSSYAFFSSRSCFSRSIFASLSRRSFSAFSAFSLFSYSTLSCFILRSASSYSSFSLLASAAILFSSSLSRERSSSSCYFSSACFASSSSFLIIYSYFNHSASILAASFSFLHFSTIWRILSRALILFPIFERAYFSEVYIFYLSFVRYMDGLLISQMFSSWSEVP